MHLTAHQSSLKTQKDPKNILAKSYNTPKKQEKYLQENKTP
jgi:hypothetical protein